MNENAFNDYIWFLIERQRIWERKQLGKPWPWTEDAVLANAKFCNVYRELDTVSRYELSKLTGRPHLDTYLICLLRHSNSPRTYETLTQGYKWDLPDVCVSDAMIGWENFPGKTQQEFVFEFQKQLDSKLNELVHKFQYAASAKDVWNAVRSTLNPSVWKEQFPHYNNFWAYEVYTSLTYCDWFPWTEDDFVFVGPGAQPALKRLGNGAEPQLPALLAKTTTELMRQTNYVWIPEQFQPKKPVFHKFTLRTLEHSLCEWRKYFEIKEGRTPRRLYTRSEG